MSEQEQRQSLVTVARTWNGTPYRHAARLKGIGADCLTLLVGIYEEAGLIPKMQLPFYAHDWHLHHSEQLYMQGVLQYCHEIPGAPQPGDIVLWQFGRCYSHGALVIEWPLVIHAYVGKVCMEEDIDTAVWLKYKNDGKTLRPTRYFSFNF